MSIPLLNILEAVFSYDEISYVMEKMNELPLTDEAKKAIENKYSKFQASISVYHHDVTSTVFGVFWSESWQCK